MSALALACSGCMAPWSSPSTPFDRHPRNSESDSATAPVRLPNANTTAADPTADMAGVIDKIEQVRALDPTAEPRLMDELRRTPPNTWPLVAEQFRATLALHQQLVAQDHAPTQSAEYLASAHSSPPPAGGQGPVAANPLAPQGLDPSHQPPPTQIGRCSEIRRMHANRKCNRVSPSLRRQPMRPRTLLPPRSPEAVR